MDIRSAILAAADWIEKNPTLYSFSHGGIVPKDDGDRACLVSKVGFYMKARAGFSCGSSMFDAYLPWMGIGFVEFNSRIRELGYYNGSSLGAPPHVKGWPLINSNDAAMFLREYADKYHPAKSLKEFLSGSEIVRAFLEKPMKENINESA